MADTNNLAGLDATQTVSALGLRWAALRGMLTSPLITAEDQRALRDELVRELGTIEQDFSRLPSRSTMEISAKVDIAKTALHERLTADNAWLVELLGSIQADLHAVHAKSAPPPAHQGRSTANLTRSHTARPDESTNPAPEADASSAA